MVAHVFSLMWIIITACGGLGAVGRCLLERHFKGTRGWTPMRAVSAINLLGCALLGLLSGIILALSEANSGGWLLTVAVAATALCGGFTTFSTAMVEAVQEPRGMKNAGTTLAVMLVGCVIAFLVMLLLGFLGATVFFSAAALPG